MQTVTKKPQSAKSPNLRLCCARKSNSINIKLTNYSWHNCQSCAVRGKLINLFQPTRIQQNRGPIYYKIYRTKICCTTKRIKCISETQHYTKILSHSSIFIPAFVNKCKSDSGYSGRKTVLNHFAPCSSPLLDPSFDIRGDLTSCGQCCGLSIISDTVFSVPGSSALARPSVARQISVIFPNSNQILIIPARKNSTNPYLTHLDILIP